MRFRSVLLTTAFLCSPPMWVMASDNQYASYTPYNVEPFRPDLNLNQKIYQPVLPTFMFSIAPDLNIGIETARVSQFQVRDLGTDVWNVNLSAPSFDAERRVIDVTGSIRTPNASKLDFQVDKLSYQAALTPESSRQTLRDANGSILVRSRSNQTSVPNPSFNSYETWVRKNYPDAVAHPDRLPATVLPPPTKELIRGFDETATLRTVTGDEVKTHTSISNMDYADGRSLTHYEGSIQNGKQSINFEVNAPRKNERELESLTVTMHALGAPSVTVKWTPTKAADNDQAIALLRDSLPVPLLIGPRTAVRMNGVDVPETATKLDAKGGLGANQIGRSQDFSELVGKEDLGISVTATASESKSKFSIGALVRDLWYSLTGHGTEVRELRNSLSSLQKSDPIQFLLATGLSDPHVMSLKDLRVATQNATRAKTELAHALAEPIAVPVTEAPVIASKPAPVTENTETTQAPATAIEPTPKQTTIPPTEPAKPITIVSSPSSEITAKTNQLEQVWTTGKKWLSEKLNVLLPGEKQVDHTGAFDPQSCDRLKELVKDEKFSQTPGKGLSNQVLAAMDDLKSMSFDIKYWSSRRAPLEVALKKEQSNTVPNTKKIQQLKNGIADIKNQEIAAKATFEKVQTWFTRKDLTDQTKADRATGQACFVVSLYLYARATNQENRLYTDFYKDILQRGFIGMGTNAPVAGYDTSPLLSDLGLTRILNKERVPEALRSLDKLGIKIAITQQDTDKKPGPNHFMLIIKSEDGNWLNWDHTNIQSKVGRRGDEIDLNYVYQLMGAIK